LVPRGFDRYRLRHLWHDPLPLGTSDVAIGFERSFQRGNRLPPALSLVPAAESILNTVGCSMERDRGYASAADISPIHQHTGAACSSGAYGRSTNYRAPCRSSRNACNAHRGCRSSHPGLSAFNRRPKTVAW
jgi:hypothetical protein